MDKSQLPEESRPLEGEEITLYNEVREKFGPDVAEDQMIRNVRAFRCNKKNRKEKTIENLELVLEWRKKVNADGILDEQLPKADVFYKCWTSKLFGEDTMGHVINFERLVDIQAEEFQQHFDVDAMIRHRCKHMERIQREKAAISKRLGRRVYKHIYIFDLKGVSRKHFSKTILGFLKPIFDLGQVYYPESLHKMFLVNAPMIFRGFWKILTPWIDPDTRTKIYVLGGKDQYMEEFKKNGLNEDAIPESLGGKHTGRMLDDSFKTSVPLESADLKA